MDEIVGPNPKIFKLAEGFQITEGPVWVRDGGYLLFSDPNANTQYKYTSGGVLSVFRTPSGYAGADIAEYGQPGSNGLTLDREGRLTINEHGNRRVTRIEKDGSLTVLADRFDGKRLNSPNDLVYRSDGTLYFTDPPFGLPKFFGDPRKELPFSGVYSLRDGKLRLLATELTGPNGIAFSPDEKFLYVYQLGREEEGRDAVRRACRWHGVERSDVLRYDVRSWRGRVGRHQGRPPGKSVRLGPWRTLGPVIGRKTPRHDRPTETPAQLCVG
jgi:sugar lactone lactonase YvrE